MLASIDGGISETDEGQKQFEVDYQAFLQTGRFSGVLSPHPDDPHRAERESLIEEIAEDRKAAALARANGKEQVAQIYDNQARHKQNDLEALPKSTEEQYAEEVNDQILKYAVSQLFNRDLVDSPVWKNPRLQQDAGIAVIERNKRSRGKVVLPTESSPFGSPNAVLPSTVLGFSLPAEVISNFKSQVHQGDLPQDPDSVFRRSWAFLHRHGYGSHGKPAVEKKAKTPKENKSNAGFYDRMTQRQFEEWRQKTAGPKGLRRY